MQTTSDYGAAFEQVRTVTGKFPQKTPQRDVCGDTRRRGYAQGY